MTDREKVKKELLELNAKAYGLWVHDQKNEFLAQIGNVTDDALALLKEQPEIVRCKNCVHKGKIEKCVLAAIAAEKDYPLFMLDNRGEWYCADGKKGGKRNDK